jgi:hydrogenase maturation protease
MPEDALFVGIGSDHGNDRVGWLVAEQLLSLQIPGLTVRRAKSPTDLLDWLDGIEWLGICDACCGAGPDGHWYRWEWPEINAQFDRPSGTHLYGLSETLHLAARISLLPPKVLLWGIEIPFVNEADRLTREVQAAIEKVAGNVAAIMALRTTYE